MSPTLRTLLVGATLSACSASSLGGTDTRGLVETEAMTCSGANTSVPDSFPLLGTIECRARFDWPMRRQTENMVGGRGAEPLGGAYDLVFTHTGKPSEPELSRSVTLILPSLEPGTYVYDTTGQPAEWRTSIANALVVESGRIYDGHTGGGPLSITIEGRTSEVVWGRVNSRSCAISGAYADGTGNVVPTYECLEPSPFGVWSAWIESERSRPVPKGLAHSYCSTDADCADPDLPRMPDGRFVTCEQGVCVMH